MNKLSNSMEQVVRVHLALMRTQSPPGDEACWCPLCRADVLALALTSLPPRYGTRRAIDTGMAAPTSSSIHDGVIHARQQVGRFPKHARGAAVAAAEPVWVVNYPLEQGFRAVDAIMRRNVGACDCWSCRCDTVAIALNRYPARYGVEYRGQTDLLEKDRAQMHEELSALLELAARVVESGPRHDLRPAD